MLLFGLVSPPPPGGSTGQPGADPDHLPPGTGALAMRVFLAALSMLFVASMLLYLIIRFRAEQWPPTGAPPLPGGIWFSTLVIVASSATIHFAVRAARQGRGVALRRWVLVTGALGLVFLAAQTWNWIAYFGAIPAELWATRPVLQYPMAPPQTDARLYFFLFFVLTGLHAAHVIGGLVAVGVVIAAAVREQYTPARYAGLAHCAAYWHFLDVVWLVMVAIITLI